MTETPPENPISLPLISLLKGVVYRDSHENAWRDLIDHQAAVADYATVLGLELIVDEAEGHAFLRQIEPDDDAPGLYLRELDIEGVDTKFIEQRRKLIGELLDQVMESRHIDTGSSGVKGFDRRYGLRRRPALVRFRILDPALEINGIDDLSLPAEQFARLDIDAATVFITENETNGLAFPPHPSAIVIFGLGYGLERLARVSWLSERRIHYWGDIDTHGFAILNRLRHHLPHAESLLMDRATLDAHRQLWTREPKDRRFSGRLDRLTHSESQLYETLRDDRLGERIRLEQERIGFGWVQGRLREISQQIASNR